jgi:hypothetical protein
LTDSASLVDYSSNFGPKIMRVSVTDAKAQLTELIRRAEAGDEIVLTPAWARCGSSRSCQESL